MALDISSEKIFGAEKRFENQPKGASDSIRFVLNLNVGKTTDPLRTLDISIGRIKLMTISRVDISERPLLVMLVARRTNVSNK